uniref:Putative secreted protein n=1 Tax=Xenopsylla cheopis TaxID=163159 RepID=A0A6M2DVB8_XENCH
MSITATIWSITVMTAALGSHGAVYAWPTVALHRRSNSRCHRAARLNRTKRSASDHDRLIIISTKMKI